MTYLLAANNPETKSERHAKLKILATVNDNWKRDKPAWEYIPSFGIVYQLPAPKQDTKPMDTPMFAQDKNEVTTLFTSDGTLQIIIGRELDSVSNRAWITGAKRITGVKMAYRDDNAPYADDQSAFAIVIFSHFSTRTHEVQQAVRAYTERFLSDLQPTAIQTSLF